MSFGRKSLSDTADIIKYVTSNMMHDTKTFISTKGYSTYELNNMLDIYGNNLLHIATLNKNPEMVEFLLNNEISHTRLNKFKHSPWDIAVMLRNDEVLDKFTDYKGKNTKCIDAIRSEFTAKLEELTKANVFLKEDNESMHTKISALNRSTLDVSTRLSTTKEALLRANMEMTRLTKRNEMIMQDSTVLSHENGRLKVDNKRLRDENDDLIDKNKKLRTSVETLMESNKK